MRQLCLFRRIWVGITDGAAMGFSYRKSVKMGPFRMTAYQPSAYPGPGARS
jgi:hypothetical protein